MFLRSESAITQIELRRGRLCSPKRACSCGPIFGSQYLHDLGATERKKSYFHRWCSDDDISLLSGNLRWCFVAVERYVVRGT